MIKLTVSAVNFDIKWKDKAFNFSLLNSIFNDVLADIIVLPEMFSTGFCMDAEEIADREGETLQWMLETAKNSNSALAGSVSIFENDNYYNRFYFVKPDGTFDYYDKRHLFSYSGEDKIYSKGTERVVVEYKGFKILLQVCYDLRFPVFSRNTDGYDIAIYVANWPKQRVFAWKHLLQARAIENQCYVVGVNRVGIDGNDLEYEESTRIFSFDGTDVSNHMGDKVLATFDKSELENFRTTFPFLNDQDENNWS